MNDAPASYEIDEHAQKAIQEYVGYNPESPSFAEDSYGAATILEITAQLKCNQGLTTQQIIDYFVGRGLPVEDAKIFAERGRLAEENRPAEEEKGIQEIINRYLNYDPETFDLTKESLIFQSVVNMQKEQYIKGSLNFGNDVPDASSMNEAEQTKIAIEAALSLELSTVAGLKHNEGLTEEQVIGFFVEKGLPVEIAEFHAKNGKLYNLKGHSEKYPDENGKLAFSIPVSYDTDDFTDDGIQKMVNRYLCYTDIDFDNEDPFFKERVRSYQETLGHYLKSSGNDSDPSDASDVTHLQLGIMGAVAGDMVSVAMSARNRGLNTRDIFDYLVAKGLSAEDAKMYAKKGEPPDDKSLDESSSNYLVVIFFIVIVLFIIGMIAKCSS